MSLMVEHFGVHELSSGVRLLVQDHGAEHALDLDVKLEVELESEGRRRRSPHRINLRDWVDVELPNDPVVRMFYPVPSGDRGIYYLSDCEENLRLVQALRRLSTPTSYAKRVLLSEAPVDYAKLALTNIQPTVAIGFHPGVFRSLNHLQAMAPILRNPVLALLPEWMAKAQPTFLQSSVRVDELPLHLMEKVGAGILRRYLRHEAV